MTKKKVASQLREDLSNLSEMTYKFNLRLLFAYNREQERRATTGERRLTYTEVWTAAGVTSGAATNWFNGTNGMALENCIAVKDVLRCNPLWLYDDSMKIDDQFSSASASAIVISSPESPASNADDTRTLGVLRRVPVVGAAQLGDNGFWAELDAPVGFGDGYIEFAVKDANAYALRCYGDSMKPRIKNGEYVIIEPNHPPVPGDEVLVKAKNGKVMVKELLYVRDDAVHLMSVNETFGKTTIPLSEIECMHFVVAITKSAMWRPD